jgi:2-keto-4-pentenoate hydratase/2-oxohepta-3-ene-1,7-dioic acid hydratase in catechol pathway
MMQSHGKRARRVITMAAFAALTVWLFANDRGLAQQAGQQPPPAAGQAQRAAQRPAVPGATTFRLLTFETGAGPRLGATVGNGEQDIVDVHNAILYLLTTAAGEARTIPAIPIDMRSLIEAGPASIAAVKSVYRTITDVRQAGKFSDPGGERRVFHPHSGVRFLPPVPNPTKVLGLAGNYVRKTQTGEAGAFDDVEYPSAFLKPPSALTGHDTEINLEDLLTTGVYEPEMTIVIGKRATNVPVSEAMGYVMGYTILNDVSSRDLPMGRHNSQGSTVSKGLDTFAPAGPYITLKEDVSNPHNLVITGVINGKKHEWPVPNGNTAYLTFTVPELVSYFSERMTLEPGDLIATGVPQPTMRFAVGDTVELTIGHLGTLRNRVVSKPVPGYKKFPPRTVAPVPTR